MDKYFNEAINLARKGMENREGGPFGAIVVDNKGRIIGYGNNQVLKNNDPTSHAEIMAIRDACRTLNTYDLSGCIVYTTSEPCPMCLSAIIWSNIKKIYFATDRNEVGKIGFRDDLIYNYLEGKSKNILEIKKINSQECNDLLKEYQDEIY